ncbi:CoA pyrophosphatase [Kushneria aurantia]|uniref:CoA pyrophosphatase n=1 Tax=Kushneria aurantia TaxID=504092 RepID=A0ABV6FZ11_9GAMM|nr:CoA pyrophosphatase [Kushneria aurantia]
MLEQAIARLHRYRPQRLADHYPRAAVLMPIVTHDAPTLLLTRRHARMRSHAGQVAFPGGKRDPGDVTLEACALRESGEEVGLAANRVQIIGRLSERLSANGMAVTPFVGLIAPHSTTLASPNEIEAIFEVALATLMNDPRQHTDVIQRGDTPLYVPSYRIGEHCLWGLSAMMVVELLDVAFHVDIGLDRYPAGSPLRHPGRKTPPPLSRG